MPELQKMYIGASRAFLITLVVLTGAFIWKTFFARAPFDAFTLAVGGVFTAYVGKRLLQKQEKYQAENRQGGGD